MFGPVSLGGNTSHFYGGRLEKTVRKKAGHVAGKPLDSPETLCEKKKRRKPVQKTRY